MDRPVKSSAHVLEAISAVGELLEMAIRVVRISQRELEGDAFALAARLSCQLEYLRGVAELLRHETKCHAGQEGSTGGARPCEAVALFGAPDH